MKLRWGAIAAQVALIFVAQRYMGSELPLLPLGALVGLGAIACSICSSTRDVTVIPIPAPSPSGAKAPKPVDRTDRDKRANKAV